MSPEESLQAVEQLVDAISAALLADDPVALEKHSQALRVAAARCAQLLAHPAAASWPQRITAIGHRLRLQRQGLARLTATTGRQLAGLLPSDAPAPTYGAGPGAAPPTAARIYRWAG